MSFGSTGHPPKSHQTKLKNRYNQTNILCNLLKVVLADCDDVVEMNFIIKKSEMLRLRSAAGRQRKEITFPMQTNVISFQRVHSYEVFVYTIYFDYCQCLRAMVEPAILSFLFMGHHSQSHRFRFREWVNKNQKQRINADNE